jgi:hypothetical protein
MLRLFRAADRDPRLRQCSSIAVPAEVSARVNENGAVFLHSGRGVVFSCNAIGARIWVALREGRATQQIAADLAAEYGVPGEVAAADAARFIGELEAAGILRRDLA